MPRSRVSRFVLAMLAVFALGVAVVNAGTITVATFADPAVDSTTPLFSLSGTTFSGGWTALGLTLETPISSQTWADAKFTMTPLTATSITSQLFTLTGGEVNFTDSANNPLLKITFDSAQLFRPFVFGASDALLHNVVFSGPIITTPIHDEQFAFSLTNEVQTAEGYTWTASFTSSAVPEPGALGALVLAGLALLRRR
jgi:MYXO-CTERM domain-containing protein